MQYTEWALKSQRTDTAARVCAFNHASWAISPTKMHQCMHKPVAVVVKKLARNKTKSDTALEKEEKAVIGRMRKAEARRYKYKVRHDRPEIDECDGRWVRVNIFKDALMTRSPWVLHWPCGGKNEFTSRVFSPTRMAEATEDEKRTENVRLMWVQGDVLPHLKKSQLVGAFISIDDTTQCHPCPPLVVGPPLRRPNIWSGLPTIYPPQEKSPSKT